MDILDSTLGSIFKNKYSSTIVTIFLIAYASLARPQLPGFMNRLFENSLFKVFLLSLIVYRGNKNPKLSILIAMAFVVIMKFLSKQKIFDGFTNVNTDDTPGFDDNVVDTDPDNVGVLDKQGSDINTSDDGTGTDSNTDVNTTDNTNLDTSDTQSSDMDMPPFNEEDEIEYEDMDTEEYPQTPEEEEYQPITEEKYKPITEESEITLEEERVDGEMCINHADGTDTCGDDEICDDGKCINAA